MNSDAGAGRGRLVHRVNQRFFYGWMIVLVAGLGMLASGPGQSHTFSVFFPVIAADLGIGKTEIAAAYSAATLVVGFFLPLVGRQIDRQGGRRVMLAVVALLGLACVLFGQVVGVVMLALGFGALRFLGQGSMMLTCNNVVSQWFVRQRGFALSLIVLGFAGSMAIHPPLAEWLIGTVGWRQAWLWLGVLTWLVMLPLVFLFVEGKPENVGLEPDGGIREARGGFGPTPAGSADAGLGFRQALGTSTFWLVGAGMFAISALVTSLHVFQVSIFLDHGLDPATAARSFPISAVTMVLAMPLIGRLLDRMPTERLFAATLVVMAASLVSVTFVDGLATAFAYAVVFGLNNAMMLSLFGYIWPRYFGRRHLGSIQGAGQTIGLVGASAGALPLGLAWDLYGSYDGMLQALAVIPLALSVAVFLFLRTPRQLAGG